MAADAKISVFIGSDTDLSVTGVEDEKANTYINDATVTGVVRVYDASVINSAGEGSEAVFAGLSNITMDYETGSNGKYVGLLPNATAFVAGTKYWTDITVISSGGTVLRIRTLAEATFYNTKRR